MKVIEYMPPFLKENRELNKIFNAEDIELENIKAKVNEVLGEVIVKTAKGYGLDRYEKIYNINNTSNSIEARRTNILFRVNFKAPYSYFWLVNIFDEAIGKNNYRILLDYEHYTLTIEVLEIYKNIAKELKEMLQKELPANLVLNINLFQTEETKIYMAGIVRIGKTIKLKQEVF